MSTITTVAISLNLTGNPVPQALLITSEIADRLTQLQTEV